jgi:sulfur carrier protein ThiS
MRNQMATAAHARPVVYIAVRDRSCRSAIVDALHRQGWAVVECPTGFHVIEAIADLIIGGRRPAVPPGMIIVDAVSQGCSGVTIAAGLRDLGLQIPAVLVAKPGDPVVRSDDGQVEVVWASNAASEIAKIARPRSPAHALDAAAAPARATA